MADLLLALALLLPAIAAELLSARGAVVYLADAAVLLSLVYVLVSDGVPAGNVGKRLGGLAVVDAHTGHACTPRQSFIRNAMLLLGPLDWFWMCGHRRQRLGDYLAGTEVITLERE